MPAKDEAIYWEVRLQKLYRNGAYYQRLQHDGVRRFVNVGRNKIKGAQRAAANYKTIQKGGWRLLDGGGSGSWDESGFSLGDFLIVVEPFVESSRSFGDYSRDLRRIVRDICGLENENVNRKVTKFRTKADQLPMAALTRESIEDWIDAFINEADNPVDKIKAEKRVHGIIRNARSLFSKPRLSKLKKSGISLTNPFEGALDGVGKHGQMAVLPYDSLFYKHEFSLEDMLARAKEEWGGINSGDRLHREAYKALILFSFAALRKSEADLLPWSHVNFRAQSVTISATEHFSPKSGSAGVIDIGPAASKALQQFANFSNSEFVLEGDPPLKDRSYAYYRSGKTLNFLTDWIRRFEWNDRTPFKDPARVQKPLHELRKEKGSRIVTEHMAILPASKFLRHKNTIVTEQHYAHLLQDISGDMEVDL